jgi:cell division protein FtsQ
VGVSLFFGMAVAGAWGFHWLTDPQVLPLRVVHIEGQLRHLPRRALERAVATHASGSFFSVDLAAVRKAAGELAWIDQVRVRRVWPDALHMRVVEQRPLARWGRDSMVNLRGEVFTPEQGPLPMALPGLSGPEGSARRVSSEFLVIGEMLRPVGLEVRALHLNARGGWQVELAAGVVLQLGTRDQEARLARFVRLYPRLMAATPGQPEEVDLRYANGFTVRWRASDQQLPMPSERRSGAHVGGRYGSADAQQQRLV